MVFLCNEIGGQWLKTVGFDREAWKVPLSITVLEKMGCFGIISDGIYFQLRKIVYNHLNHLLNYVSTRFLAKFFKFYSNCALSFSYESFSSLLQIASFPNSLISCFLMYPNFRSVGFICNFQGIFIGCYFRVFFCSWNRDFFCNWSDVPYVWLVKAWQLYKLKSLRKRSELFSVFCSCFFLNNWGSVLITWNNP